MDLEELGKTVGATTVVGGGLAWTFREKLAAWAKGLTADRFTLAEGRLTVLEQAQSAHAAEVVRMSEAMEQSSLSVADSIRRLTVAMERIADKHEDTGKAVARIEGSLEALKRS